MNTDKQYPSALEQTSNILKTGLDVAKSSISGESLLVSDEIKNQRMEICKSCEWFEARYNRCIKCGCFLRIKTTLAASHCPLHKWS